MNDRLIGRVISVEGFRVVIRLDDGIKGQHKSGYEDIYEVGKVNSYIIIPVGPDRIVAVVTAVKTVDETQLAKDRTAIYLTESVRYITATMVGTILGGKYKLGVTVFPTIDGPVWYVTRIELNYIFDEKDGGQIDFSNDYYLPIGESASFPEFKVKINPDKFFGKHAAILGNTGSGKSCTVASILQSLFEHDYNGGSLKHAHIIIFDTNGEYRQAFFGDKAKDIVPPDSVNVINPFYIDKEGLKVPYWFMNYDDFEYLFEPSGGAQAPILKRAIGLARNKVETDRRKALSQVVLTRLNGLADLCASNDTYKLNQVVHYDLEGITDELRKYNIGFNLKPIIDSLEELKKGSSLEMNKGFINGSVKINALVMTFETLQNELQKLNEYLIEKEIKTNNYLDIPIWFEFSKLINEFIEEALSEENSQGNKIREYLSTLKIRLQSFLTDERYSDPFLFSSNGVIKDGLPRFLSYLLGDFQLSQGEVYTDYINDYISAQLNDTELPEDICEKSKQLTVLDMSLFPNEVLEAIASLVARIILEFVSRFPQTDRGKLPIVFVLEEAQNYIPEKDKKERISISKKVFERIAREGRKYGLSLVLSSQRPSELSKTVLSQCNSFIIHRLQNPEDQKYIRQLVSSASEDILQQLPILPQQHAIIMGDAVRSPVQVKIRDASPVPNSHDPKFVENWLKDYPEGFPPYKEIADAWEKGEKYEPDSTEIIPAHTPIADVDTSVEEDNPF